MEPQNFLETSEHASDDASDRYEDDAFDASGNVKEQQTRGFGSCCSQFTKAKCRSTFKLSGNVSVISTQNEKIYCWNLIVDNCAGKNLKNIDLCLDIRSLQVDEEFQIGPGVFGPDKLPEATYSIDASENVSGEAVSTYEGTGTFYQAKILPIHSCSFTVCATFPLPNPKLDFTQVLDSPFTVKPQQTRKNYNPCSAPSVISTTEFIKGCDSPPALLCPEFVEWDGSDINTDGPSNPCTECSADGRIRFAVDVSTTCVTHICRDGTWTCIGAS